MALVVKKFGGTSVGSIDRIKVVAKRIKTDWESGQDVIVVVSARAGVTNELINRARSLSAVPSDREMDMLLAVGEQETIALMAIALQSLGVPAVSRTGPQAGIVTDFAHTRARIRSINGGDIKERLAERNVVIVAGFQGISERGQVTTFGRGGSDLTGIALAAALDAEKCEIYTDVDGVYTADPRIVPDAQKIQEISYEELLELASSGSKVMQARAVEFAQKYNVTFEVRSSFNHNTGTIVKAEAPSMEDVVVSGVAVDNNQAKIVVRNVPDRAGTAAKVFQVISEAGVIVDMIVQNIGHEGKANLTFTVPRDDIYKAEKAVKQLYGDEVTLSAADEIAKISVVGIGMRSHSGVAAAFFAALAETGISIQLINTSEIKISVAIKPEEADEAARAVHDAFGLGDQPNGA